MYHSGLADWTLAAQEIAPASGSSNVNGTNLDMQGWDGVQYQINLGAFTGAATLDARVVSTANSNGAGAANISGAALTQVPAANASNLFIIDVFRPTDRYLRVCLVPGANTLVYGVTSVRYRAGGTLPPTQSALQYVKVDQN